MGGLRLDSQEGARKGGNSGPAILPGNPKGILVIQAVRRTHACIKMPPSAKLPDADIEALVEWVIVTGWTTLDTIAGALLFAGEVVEPRLSGQVCGRPETPGLPEQPRVSWRVPAASGQGRLREVSGHVVSRRLGGICEAPLRRSRTSFALS